LQQNRFLFMFESNYLPNMNFKFLTENFLATWLITKLAKKTGMSQKNAKLLASTLVPIVMAFILEKASESKTAKTKKK